MTFSHTCFWYLDFLCGLPKARGLWSYSGGLCSQLFYEMWQNITDDVSALLPHGRWESAGNSRRGTLEGLSRGSLPLRGGSGEGTWAPRGARLCAHTPGCTCVSPGCRHQDLGFFPIVCVSLAKCMPVSCRFYWFVVAVSVVFSPQKTR